MSTFAFPEQNNEDSLRIQMDHSQVLQQLKSGDTSTLSLNSIQIKSLKNQNEYLSVTVTQKEFDILGIKLKCGFNNKNAHLRECEPYSTTPTSSKPIIQKLKNIPVGSRLIYVNKHLIEDWTFEHILALIQSELIQKRQITLYFEDIRNDSKKIKYTQEAIMVHI